jgi:iron complex outermembrane receptor protein
MKSFSLFICIYFSAPVWLYAQSSKVTGQIIGSGKPVFAATVALINTADSTNIKRAVTDSAGRFIIQIARPGTYRLRVTCIGYQTYVKTSMSVGQADFALGQIMLIPEKAKQLNEVLIRAKKPFIEHKLDRTVIKVDALATNQGISAADVLEKSPGILIDPVNGAISFEGKSGAVVYIDDKKSYLTGNDLVAYLQSLPSGSLQSIELMTNPPAKYDASGGAVINIRLKKNVIKGFNGGYPVVRTFVLW